MQYTASNLRMHFEEQILFQTSDFIWMDVNSLLISTTAQTECLNPVWDCITRISLVVSVAVSLLK